MIKIVITKDDPVYRGHADLKIGMIGYLTKETQEETSRFAQTRTGMKAKITRIRFAATQLGYEGREPIFCWVPNHTFEIAK